MMSTNNELPIVQNLIYEAEYHPSSLPEHAGNPLIETLPPFHPAAEMINSFANYPKYSIQENQILSDPERMYAVLRLNNYLEPLTAHLEVIEQVSLNIRTGYVSRNPIDNEYRKAQIRFYHQAMRGEICPLRTVSSSTAPSILLAGVSGTGKTTTVERILSFLPQVLNHSKYGFIQIVYLKIECPPDGSVKQFLLSILRKIDNLINTNYQREVGENRTVDSLILDVAKVLVNHHLGILIIDEIQNLLDAKGLGQAKLINTLVSYVNEAKIPMLTIGTPRALQLLDSAFRSARRVADHGAFIWQSLPYGDEFMHFIECLSKYQWTKHSVNLVDFRKTIYEYTQGIHVLIVRLSQLAQLRAIRTKTEKITEELIRDIANDKFKPLEPMLDAIKKGNQKSILKYDDLLCNGLHKIKSSLETESKLQLIKENKSKNQEFANRANTVSILMQMGYEQGPIQEIASSIFDQNPDYTCEKAVRTILDLLSGQAENNSGFETKSLKEIVDEAKSQGLNPVDALTAIGRQSNVEKSA